MSFSVGIIGLPNVGKSTLFKALTCQAVAIAPRPFTTIDPNHGMVAVPDERLEKISAIVKPQKTTPTIIEFVDIAGLVRNAWKGEGLGNQFLAQIRNCDAILEVVRAFNNQNIQHTDEDLDPQRDIGIIRTELLMKDLETIESALIKVEKKNDPQSLKKTELLRKLKSVISQGFAVREIILNQEEKEITNEFQFLTEKPIIFVLNIDEKNTITGEKTIDFLKINLKLEEETTELSRQEIEELEIKRFLPELIVACYRILDLITFYTVAGGQETRAWTLKKNSNVLCAAGQVHSDFQEKFIRAEVIPWQDLIASASWKQAKEKGLLKIVGRDYLVQDGDIIEFKI